MVWYNILPEIRETGWEPLPENGNTQRDLYFIFTKLEYTVNIL